MWVVWNGVRILNRRGFFALIGAAIAGRKPLAPESWETVRITEYHRVDRYATVPVPSRFGMSYGFVPMSLECIWLAPSGEILSIDGKGQGWPI